MFQTLPATEPMAPKPPVMPTELQVPDRAKHEEREGKEEENQGVGGEEGEEGEMNTNLRIYAIDLSGISKPK